MNRYVRTRNGKIFDTQPRKVGVFEGSQFFIHNGVELVERYPEEYGADGTWCVRFLYRGVGVVKMQSDDLRDLCDCYAYKTETTRDYNVARGWNINDRDIYGCILTEKGIIYVARFNSVGELVLL